jgi:chromosome segregation ATPase
MFTLFLVLILIGAFLALLAGVRALGAWLSFRRTRATFQKNVAEEVDRLSRRTGELEASLSALDARAQQLPVRISRLQESLTTLRVLTGALGTSLRQAQRILAVTRLKTTGTARLADLLGKWQRALENRPPA